MTEMRFCKFCNLEHPLTTEYWYISRNRFDHCKAYHKAYYKNYSNTRDMREYRNEYYRKYNYKRRRSDEQFRLTQCLRSRMGKIIRNLDIAKHSSVIKSLGCTLEQLKEHIEKQFQPGMSWKKHGVHGFHIDHIRPLCSFDLSDPEQYKQACHYTNLQPLWAKDNLSKNGRYDQRECV